MLELKADGVQRFQERVGQLWWAVEIGCVNLLLETSFLLSYLTMPQFRHLEQAFHIFRYLKSHPTRKIGFDPSHPTINENRFQGVIGKSFTVMPVKRSQRTNRNPEAIAWRHIVLLMQIMPGTRKQDGHKPVSFCFVTRRQLCGSAIGRIQWRH
jgi:hypothetical protein